MSNLTISHVTDTIVGRLAKYRIPTKVSHSSKSNSVYIHIANSITIRVSDHYTNKDYLCEYNIGEHISRFKRSKKSYYYRSNRVNELIIRLLKDIKDNRILS